MPARTPEALATLSESMRQSVQVLVDLRDGARAVVIDARQAQALCETGHWQLAAMLPPVFPEWLGDRSFSEVHGTRFPYVGGAMANGIATTQFVIELARARCLGFFGAAGLSPGRVEGEVAKLAAALSTESLSPRSEPWGVNLIHSPSEPAIEDAVCAILLRHGVRCVEASAYMALTPAVVRYAATGLRRAPDGSIQRRNRLLAKVSREEVARRFLEPAAPEILAKLVDRGDLTRAEAELAAQIPIAEDITAEADSGGHTDNRPLTALLPSLLALRDRIASERGYQAAIRIGAAGGIGTPTAVAAAFALGAAYVQTGSVNQSCVESGLGAEGRAMLCAAGMADVIMAPAADMFEMGVDVQVLRRGTLFAVRARKLYELYRAHSSLDEIPAAEREKVERVQLRATFDEAWESTRAFWMSRDPGQVTRAERDPKHRMALVFRAYLGLSSRWAIDGLAARSSDYQIWCGPAMGAFNSWVKGSFLEVPENRSVVQVARNLMEGAAAVTRAQQLRSFGVAMPASSFDFRPRQLA